jgi:hypothetical protein
MRSGAALCVLLLSGCGILPGGTPDGPCSLTVMDRTGAELSPPYVIEVGRVPGAPGGGDLMFKGSGWSGVVDMTGTGPTGERVVSSVDSSSINDGVVGMSVSEPGVWRYRVDSDAAGCSHEFEVEAR